MTQSMRNPAHIGLKQEENDSPSRSPSEQQRSTSTDTPVQHRFMTPSTYHINGDRIEYVDMQGNHFATTHSAPLPLHQLLPPKPAKYEPFAQPGAIEPPFRGYCENTHDALILFEAAKRGIIPRVTRRLTDREKAAMIKSGAVFVFDEHESNIKRWTDGMSWSPSRIYGNYLTYREIVDKAEALATANMAGITSADTSGLPQNTKPYPRNPLPGTARNRPHLSAASVSGLEAPGDENRPRSASDAQQRNGNGKKGSQSAKNFWRPNGLVKRTISVLVNGYHQHLVSYYNPTDVHEDRLYRPRDVPMLAELEIGDEYLRSDSFRLPIQTTLTPDGRLQYVGDPNNVPGQSNNQAQADQNFAAHSTMPAPPATAPMRQQTVYNISPQGYAFASVPQEAVLDHSSHSRPSTGTSHGSVITPMSPVTSGNYYDNYLEQEQQKAMINTAPVGWQVPLPKPTQRPHTTQFGGSTTMVRQLSEGTGRDKMSNRIRTQSRYQPYGSPDQANFPQNTVQLVLPGQPSRSAGMRRTPSFQNGQGSYMPMTPVAEGDRDSSTVNNVVLINSAGMPYDMQPPKMQPSPTQTIVSQESSQDMQQTPYGASEVSTPQYSQTSFQQNGSTPKSAAHHARSYSNSYASLDDMAVAGAVGGVASNIAWAGTSSNSASPQYMSAPAVKTELLTPASDSAEMTRSYSNPGTGGMNPYPPQMTMQFVNPNGGNGGYSMPNSNQQWMMPMMPQDQSRTMMPPPYPQQSMMAMAPQAIAPPPQVVLSGWQNSMSNVYQDTQQPQTIQTVYYSQPGPRQQ